MTCFATDEKYFVGLLTGGFKWQLDIKKMMKLLVED